MPFGVAQGYEGLTEILNRTILELNAIPYLIIIDSGIGWKCSRTKTFISVEVIGYPIL